MKSQPNDHPLSKKLDRITYLLEVLVALELNKTNLDRNTIRARLGIDKTAVNKILNQIEKKK